MNKMRGVQAYAKVGIESQVLSASPHQLISLLFANAESSIRAALIHLQANNIAERGAAISKAISIVQGGLQAALDLETGGEVADNLYRLYDFVIRQLMEANREQSSEKLEKASEILEMIASSWRSVGIGAN
jgi:flagellar protein FliS